MIPSINIVNNYGRHFIKHKFFDTVKSKKGKDYLSNNNVIKAIYLESLSNNSKFNPPLLHNFIIKGP